MGVGTTDSVTEVGCSSVDCRSKTVDVLPSSGRTSSRYSDDEGSPSTAAIYGARPTELRVRDAVPELLLEGASMLDDFVELCVDEPLPLVLPGVVALAVNVPESLSDLVFHALAVGAESVVLSEIVPRTLLEELKLEVSLSE